MAGLSSVVLFLFIIAAISWLEHGCSVAREVVDGRGLHALTITCVIKVLKNDAGPLFLNQFQFFMCPYKCVKLIKACFFISGQHFSTFINN